MSALVQIPRPPEGADGSFRYAIRPRAKRDFHGVLDASQLVDARRPTTVTLSSTDAAVTLTMEHPVLSGRIREDIRYEHDHAGLRARSLLREVLGPDGEPVRREHVSDFHGGAIQLPAATYPEVSLPFLLGWLPLDGKRRSVYAWINDRFVARVYVEAGKRTRVTVASETVEAREVLMYPDLNDWVPLGALLTRLAMPFIPKYRMVYALDPPHRLVRFEGPYGPPGAPEIVLELTD